MSSESVCNKTLKIFGEEKHAKEGDITRSLASTVSFVLFILTMVHLVVGIVVFALARNVYLTESQLSVRSVVRVCVMGVGVTAQMVNGTIAAALGTNNIPCWLSTVSLFIIIPCMTAPKLVELIWYYNRYVFEQYKKSYEEKTVSSGFRVSELSAGKRSHLGNSKGFQAGVGTGTGARVESSNLSSEGFSVVEGEDEQQLKCREAETDSKKVTIMAPEKGKRTDLSTTTLSAETEDEEVRHIQENVETMSESNVSSQENLRLRNLFALRFFSSTIWEHIVLAALIFPYLLLAVIFLGIVDYRNPANGCTGCGVEPTGDAPMLPVLALCAAVTLAIGIWSGLRVRKLQDPFGVATEARNTFMFGGCMAFFGFLLKNLVKSLTSNNFHIDWLVTLGLNLMFFTSSTYQVWLAYKEHKLLLNLRTMYDQPASQLGGLRASQGNNSVPLPRITVLEQLLKAKDSTLRDKFRDVLEHRLSLDMLQFYKAALAFQQHFYSKTESARKAQARKIVKTYIVSGAPIQINIDAQLRERIERKVGLHDANSQQGLALPLPSRKKSLYGPSPFFSDVAPVTISVDLFSTAAKQMLRLMANGPFVKFFADHYEAVMALPEVKQLLESRG